MGTKRSDTVNISANRVVEAMEERGINQRQLAEFSMINECSLSRILRTGRASYKSLFWIARNLDVAESFITGELSDDDVTLLKRMAKDKGKSPLFFIENEHFFEGRLDALDAFLSALGYTKRSVKSLSFVDKVRCMQEIERISLSYLEKDLFWKKR